MEDVTHLCSPNSNEEGGSVTPGEDGKRTRVPALTGEVEGKKTARRRQLPGSDCVMSQEAVLHLCQGRLRSLPFLLSPNNLCLVLCAAADTDTAGGS